MRTVPQRELRNDIARVLREVDVGETVQITVRGQVVAELHPPPQAAAHPVGDRAHPPRRAGRPGMAGRAGGGSGSRGGRRARPLVVSAGLLDTSTIIGGLPAAMGDRLPGLLAVSVMTLGELHAGVLMASHPRVRAARLARLGDVQREFAILDVDPRAAQIFGELRARSGRRGVADLLIAATALANGMLLVTRNERRPASWAIRRFSPCERTRRDPVTFPLRRRERA